MVLNRYMTVAAAVTMLGLVACGDEAERILVPVPDESREATLVDISGGPITQPSAFDVLIEDVVRTDQTPGWDFVLEYYPDGKAVLWPRNAIVEEDGDSGLQLVAETFDGLTAAPENGYVQTKRVPINVGDVLAVRSRRDPLYGSVRCRRFAKIEVLTMDTAEGSMTFRHLVNPNCEKRSLVPGAEE